MLASKRSAALLLATVLLPFATSRLPAQGEGADADAKVQARIDKMLADYKKVRRDKNKLAQRRRLIGWLGEIDHERVTDYLRQELKAYARWGFGVSVIDAIGKVERPSLEKDLIATLKGGKTSHPVRVAAAEAVIAFGKDSGDRVLEIASAVDPKDAIPAARLGAVEALARSESVALHRGLARLLVESDNPQRVLVLRHSEAAKSSAINNARIRCVKQGNLMVAAIAWRILAEQGHSRAKDLTIDVLERILGTVSADAAAELVRGIVLVKDRDFYPAVLRFGAVRGRQVKRALEIAAPNAARDPKLLEWLVQNGVDSESAGERHAAKVLLRHAPIAVLQPLIDRVRKDLKRNRKKVLDTAAGLHELLSKDPAWEQDLATLAAASDLDSRLIGLSMLLEMTSRAGIPSAQKYLRHKQWELRSVAIRYLTKCRDATSVPLLLQRYGKEEGRLAHELDQALFVHTGTRCFSAKEWRDWWRKRKEGFVLPHANTIKQGGTTTGGSTASYYGMPLVSSRMAFIVDCSGSMDARVGTDRKRTRLVAAREQLRLAIEKLPKTHFVNLVPFQSVVRTLWEDARKLKTENRKEFLDVVSKLRAAGGTNTYGALMQAFDDPNIDTIYLLTDGVPTAGELTDTEEILDAVLYENRTRQIVIHCISIGLDSELLKDLAALTGGEYRYVR